MIVEKFDFKGFFNAKNISINQRIRDYGIGAVSIITPKQAITRLTLPDAEYRIPGMGEHKPTAKNIAEEILPIKDNKIKIPIISEWLGKIKLEQDFNEQIERKGLIKDFLNSTIKIDYVSRKDTEMIIVKFPGFDPNNWNTSNISLSKDMYLGLVQILMQLERDDIPCDIVRLATNKRCHFENYQQTKEYIETLVDQNFEFPFEEKIIAKQISYENKEKER